jgi:phosphomannomutase
MTDSQSVRPAFLRYDPVPLAFGTSGLRGLVKDMTDLETYVNVAGALRYLVAAGDIASGGTVLLGGDLRPSSERIMRAAARAISDAGMRIENAGLVPTPALALHAFSSGMASVMVSGSHIPFDRNGIKLMKRAGEVLKADEAPILAEVARVRGEEYGRTPEASLFDSEGMLKARFELPPRDGAAEERYVRRYVSLFEPGRLTGMRIVVYQHSAVGRDILPRILRELGAEVTVAGRTESFVPIDTENITREELSHVEALVRSASGGPFDAVVSTDGDSDRPFVAAVDLANATNPIRFMPGDLLGIVVAEYLGADAVAVPISANDAVEQRMRAAKIELRTTRIGSPYVVAALDELAREGFRRPVGWEANGGFLVGRDIDLGRSMLAALPTRDSVLPIVANLCAARARGMTLGALWDELPRRFGRAGLIDGVPVPVSRAILAHLMRAGAGAIEEHFTSARGFDGVSRVDSLDGLRIYFSNGDIAHLRPSGNAPQLRVYANASSDERAAEIVAHCLREPDGILQALIRAVSES